MHMILGNTKSVNIRWLAGSHGGNKLDMSLFLCVWMGIRMI